MRESANIVVCIAMLKVNRTRSTNLNRIKLLNNLCWFRQLQSLHTEFVQDLTHVVTIRSNKLRRLEFVHLHPYLPVKLIRSVHRQNSVSVPDHSTNRHGRSPVHHWRITNCSNQLVENSFLTSFHVSCGTTHHVHRVAWIDVQVRMATGLVNRVVHWPHAFVGVNVS